MYAKKAYEYCMEPQWKRTKSKNTFAQIWSECQAAKAVLWEQSMIQVNACPKDLIRCFCPVTLF